MLLETEWWRMKVVDQKTKASGEAITIFSMDLVELPRTSGIEEISFRRYQLYGLWHTLSVMLAMVAFYVVLMVPHYLIKRVLNPGRDTEWTKLTVRKEVMLTEKQGWGSWLRLGSWISVLGYSSD